MLPVALHLLRVGHRLKTSICYCHALKLYATASLAEDKIETRGPFWELVSSGGKGGGGLFHSFWAKEDWCGLPEEVDQGMKKKKKRRKESLEEITMPGLFRHSLL
jgi:hypothetical protein